MFYARGRGTFGVGLRSHHRVDTAEIGQNLFGPLVAIGKVVEHEPSQNIPKGRVEVRSLVTPD